MIGYMLTLPGIRDVKIEDGTTAQFLVDIERLSDAPC